MICIKRDGRTVEFDKAKIKNAIEKAMACTSEGVDEELAKNIADAVQSGLIENFIDKVHIETIQDLVEKCLMESYRKDVAREYVVYRRKRQDIRECEAANDAVLEIIDVKNKYINEENSNKNSTILSTQRDYMAGEVSKDLTYRLLLPEDITEAHKKGLIHFHDADYFAQHMFNCCLINLEDMLQNGTVISEVMIEKPHSFSTACNIATQIIAQIASNQYGGQTISLSHLAPFVDVSRKKIKNQILREYTMINGILPHGEDAEICTQLIEERVREEIRKGIQTIQYQVITLQTSNGQSPFLSLFMYLNEVPDGQIKEDLAMIIEEVLEQRMQGVKNKKGIWITPAFPKLLYVLEEDNIHEDSKYFYLTKLAAKCSAKRLVPDYISEKIMKQIKVDDNGDGQCFPCMGCRSFLSTYLDENGKPKYYGRFNQGVVTINLPHVALSSYGDFNKFWEIFDSRLELCHRALQLRHKRLEGTLSNVSPIHWQHGAIARLKTGETIDKLLHGNYSTASLGYAGLYECVKYMTGESHTSDKGKEFALQVMKHMNEMCEKWKSEENVGYSLYGTPLESTTYKFAEALKRDFEEVEGITNYDYITNSYHVNVREQIDAFTKLKFESEFQPLSSGGAISYIEVGNMRHNIDAIISVIKFIYDNIMYAEVNTKSDFCHVCGYDGEMKVSFDEDAKKSIWTCPNCGNTDQTKMNVARRTCG